MFGIKSSSLRPVFSIPSTITVPTYGIAYSQTLNVTESYVSYLGNYSFVVTSGSLPSGITLTASAKSFVLSGTPTSKSSYAFTIRASLAGVSYSQTYSGTPSVTKITATGGVGVIDYNGYRLHGFIGSGNFVISSGCDDVEVMLLSGGGGGRGDGNGGGGGGGGGKKVSTVTRVGANTYSVVIGGGGAAGTAGTASSALGVSVAGGGAGGAFGTQGGSGGSGGGGGGFASGGLATISGTSGYNGGAGAFYNGGGGGGMGGVGNNGNASPNETGGYGGAGQLTPFVSGWQDPATLVGRGGGGGGGGGAGGGVALPGAGGGEGRGNSAGGVGQDGQFTYGAGGGGGYLSGGNGGSGVVWIRYPL